MLIGFLRWSFIRWCCNALCFLFLFHNFVVEGQKSFFNCLKSGDTLYPRECLYSDDLTRKACLIDDGRFCVISSLLRIEGVLTFSMGVHSIPPSACLGYVSPTVAFLSFFSNRIEGYDRNRNVSWQYFLQGNSSSVLKLSTVLKNSTEHDNELLQFLPTTKGCHVLDHAITTKVTVAAIEYQDQSKTVFSSNILKINYTLDSVGVRTISAFNGTNCKAGQQWVSIKSTEMLKYWDRISLERICEMCPRGTYREDDDELNSCSFCPAGQSTSSRGSTSYNSCYGVLSSTIMGAAALGVFLTCWGVYFAGGRIFRLAARCKYIVHKIMSKTCLNVSTLLSLGLVSALMTNMEVKISRSNEPPIRTFKDEMQPVINFLVVIGYIIFFLVFISITILVSICTLFVNGMIVIRTSQNKHAFQSFVKYCFHILETMFGEGWIERILAPFVYVLDILSSLSIPLTSMEVTCDGAAMIAWLSIDLLIVLVVLIFIWSDISIYWNISLKRCMEQYVLLLTNETYIRYRKVFIFADLCLLGFTNCLPSPSRVILYMFSFYYIPQVSETFGRCGVIDTGSEYIVASLFVLCIIPVLCTMGSILVPSSYRQDSPVTLHSKNTDRTNKGVSNEIDQTGNCPSPTKPESTSTPTIPHPSDLEACTQSRPTLVTTSSAQFKTPKLETHSIWMRMYHIVERCFEYNLSYLMAGHCILQVYVTRVFGFISELQRKANDLKPDVDVEIPLPLALSGTEKMFLIMRYLRNDVLRNSFGFTWYKVLFPATIRLSLKENLLERLDYVDNKVLYPSYYDMMREVSKETPWLAGFWWLPFAPFVNSTGQTYLFHILTNMLQMLMASLGIWTDDMVNKFQLLERYGKIRSYDIKLPNRSLLLKMIQGLHDEVAESVDSCSQCLPCQMGHLLPESIPRFANIGAKRNENPMSETSSVTTRHSKFNGKAFQRRESTKDTTYDSTELLELIAAMITVRVGLFQLLPYGGYISVILADLACCPLFIISYKLDSKLQSELADDPAKYARGKLGLDPDETNVDGFTWLRVEICAMYETMNQSRTWMFYDAIIRNLTVFLILHHQKSGLCLVFMFLLLISVVGRAVLTAVHFGLFIINAMTNDRTDSICRQLGLTTADLVQFNKQEQFLQSNGKRTKDQLNHRQETKSISSSLLQRWRSYTTISDTLSDRKQSKSSWSDFGSAYPLKLSTFIVQDDTSDVFRFTDVNGKQDNDPISDGPILSDSPIR